MNSREVYTYLLDLENQLQAARYALKRIIQLTHKYGHPGTNLDTHRSLSEIRKIAVAAMACGE